MSARGAVPRRRPGRAAVVIAVLAALLPVLLVASMALGRYGAVELASPSLLLRDLDPTAANVLVRLRLPRVVTAACVGAMLAMSGCAYQGLFRTPMVSPDILGASAGAGFGAALGILLSFGPLGVRLTSFLLGVAAVAFAYLISRGASQGAGRTLVLVLCGMVVQSLFTALTSAVKSVADPNSQLPEITFWLMGGLSGVRVQSVPWVLVPLLVGGTALFALRWHLDVMTMGDDEAAAMGVDVRRTRLAVVLAATLMTSAAVSVAGMVGWVGLIVPHMSRFLVGPDHRVLVPASALLGASFLVVVDDVCRSVYTTEIPLSILTSLIEAPLFVYLVSRRGRA